MYCKHCGAQIEDNSRFCTSCGREVLGKTPSTPAEDERKKRMPGWFKFLFGLIAAGLLLLGFLYALKEDITESVEGQLLALRSNKITEAYYGFTSKDFQNSTPLDVFREFIKTYPVFSANKTFSIDHHYTNEGVGTINGTLASHSGDHAEVQYKVIKEGDKWKILSIKLAEPSIVENAQNSTVIAELISPLEAQLNALRKQDYASAYQYVAKDFAADTPLEKFESFIKNYPIFANFKKIEFENYTVKDNQADVTIVLHSDQGAIPAEYRLIKEDGKWKLWSLKLFLPTNQLDTQIKSVDTKSLFELIENQLKTLQSGEIKKAYERFSSKEFKKVTPLDDFIAFIKHNPLLSKHTGIDFQNPGVIKNQSRLKVELNGNDQSAIIEYTLDLEDQAWKISGMRALENSKTSQPELMVREQDELPISKLLSRVIAEQLEAIRKKDFAAAYNEFTSDGFKQATTLKEFIAFINSQPAFYDNDSSKLHQLSFNNNIGTFKGTMKGKNSQAYTIEYDLVKERDRWKILHILISPTAVDSPQIFSGKESQLKKNIEK